MPKQVRSRVWMAWAFVPFLSGVAFVLAGRRAKVRAWQLTGWALIALTVIALPMTETDTPSETDLYDFIIGAVAIGWLAAMVGVFLIRPRYERRMAELGQSVPVAEPRRVESPVSTGQQSYASGAPGSGPPPMSIPSTPPIRPQPQPPSQQPHAAPPAPVTPQQTEDQLDAAGLGSQLLDLNTATPTQLEVLPAMTPARAERAVGYRDGRGGFRDFAEFVKAVGLQPHEAEPLRRRVTVREPPRPLGDKGRVLDL